MPPREPHHSSRCVRKVARDVVESATSFFSRVRGSRRIRARLMLARARCWGPLTQFSSLCREPRIVKASTLVRDFISPDNQNSLNLNSFRNSRSPY